MNATVISGGPVGVLRPLDLVDRARRETEGLACPEPRDLALGMALVPDRGAVGPEPAEQADGLEEVEPVGLLEEQLL